MIIVVAKIGPRYSFSIKYKPNQSNMTNNVTNRMRRRQTKSWPTQSRVKQNLFELFLSMLFQQQHQQRQQWLVVTLVAYYLNNNLSDEFPAFLRHDHLHQRYNNLNQTTLRLLTFFKFTLHSLTSSTENPSREFLDLEYDRTNDVYLRDLLKVL